MPCPSCQRTPSTSTSTSYICTHCLNKLLKLYKNQTSSHTAHLLPSAVEKAKKGIAILGENRVVEAAHYDAKNKVGRLKHELERLRRVAESDTADLQAKRAYLSGRKERLRLARLELERQQAQACKHDDARQEIESCNVELAHTRRVLLEEVLEAFVVGPSSVRGCSFNIGSLPVPRLAMLQKLPRHQLNATLALLIHFMRLSTLYLGIKLPFEILGTPLKPLIKPTHGNSNSLRYPKPYPLYASSGSSSSDAQAKPPDPNSAAPRSSTKNSATPSSHARALSTGLSMLAYNANYLYHISQLDAALAQAEPSIDDILAMLVEAFRSPNIGQRSHSALQEPYNLPQNTEWPERSFQSFLKELEMIEERDRERMRSDQDVVDQNKAAFIVVQQQQQEEEKILGSQDEEWDVL